jgi:signal peptide peptidase SppA
MSRYAHVLAYLTAHPWAILPETLRAMVEVISIRIEGGRIADDEVAARLAAAKGQQGPRAGKRTGVTAVIPVYGVIMPRASIMEEMSGATSLEAIRRDFREALNDDDVARIVFDIDSPGGSVEGVEEFADEIRAARGVKPMTAVADYLMASAAYWIGSQADEIVASPSSMVGSIGVYAIHTDASGAYEMLGVRPTLIKAGKYKAEGIDFEPLSDEARGHFQESVDDSYDAFVSAVAKGRGVTPAAVRSGYGEGRALTAKRAKTEGLVDRVDTLDGAFAKTPKMRSAEDLLEVAAAGDDHAQGDSFIFELERRRRHGLRPA